METAPARDSVAPHTTMSAKERGRVITILLVAAFTVILNETVMGVAIPHLMEDLNVSAVAAQWLTTAFLLTMAVVIPMTGFLLQRFSTRHMFAAAMGMFIIGTALAAAAPGFEVLVVARVVQACGTAVMLPLLMTTVMTLEPAETRGRRMGNISIVISVAPALGPTLSGLILSVAPWRFLFVAVLPIAVTVAVLGQRALRNINEPGPAPLDLASVVMTIIGFGSLVFGLSRIGESANGLAPATIAGLAVGTVTLAVFVWRQLFLQRQDKALLDLRTFRERTFTVSAILFVITMMGLFGTIILLPLFMQQVLELSVLHSGLLLLPGGLVMGLLAPSVGRAFDRWGPRPLLIPGMAIASIALWVLGLTLSDQTPWWGLLVFHIFLSFGLALVFTPLFTSSLGSLPPALYSHGSAIVSTVQQVAGAAGTALFIGTMAAIALTRVESGFSDVSAQADGIRLAVLLGAVLITIGTGLATMIGKTGAQAQPAH